MLKALANARSHIANWREWELNPVVVKELRQAVRSWAVTGMLLLFLVVLFITSLVFLVGQSFTVNANERLGATIFQAFITILTGASMVFIPLYVGVRLAVERVESNLDLLYISTLTPGRIIRGKFLCGAYMAVLFFSACMPFMAFTNLLRGVDLPSIFFILLYVFLIVCLANQVAIFLACLPLSRPFKILLALIGTILMFVMVMPVVGASWQLMRSGVGAMMAGRGFWVAFATTVGLCFAGALLLYFLSVALISPVSANRALPLRAYLTSIWVLGLGLSLYWVWRVHDARLILPWAILTYFLMTAALIVAISSHDELSLRVRRDIPSTRARRALAFFFFNGAASGVVWVMLLMGVTLLIATWVLQIAPAWRPSITTMSSSDLDEFFKQTSGTVAYTLAYALTGLILHRRLFKGRSPRLAGILTVILAGGWALVPYMASFFFNRLSWQTFERLQLGNVFNIYIIKDRDDLIYHLVFAVGWLMIMLLLNVRWFAAQWRNFKPLDRSAPIPTSPPPLPQPSATA